MDATLEAALNSPAVERIGWALVHSLWQGLGVGAMLAIALAATRRRSANLRYALACAAMLLMLAAPVVTFLFIRPGQVVPSEPGAAGRPAAGTTQTPVRPLPRETAAWLTDRCAVAHQAAMDISGSPADSSTRVLSEQEIARLADQKPAVEDELLARLANGSPGAALMLADLGSQKALPLLRKQLLADRYFYGWDGPDYSTDAAAYARDDQFPHHIGYITAIERLTGKPVAGAVSLTDLERRALEAEAATAQLGGDTGPWVAKWLLTKLAPHPGPPPGPPATGGLVDPWEARLARRLQPALPWLVFGWLIGVAGMSLWYLVGWLRVRRLGRLGVSPASESACRMLADLSARPGLRRAVRVAQSALVAVPTLVGWLRPIILLPASALTGLSAEQLESILAHELAHVRRHDYLVNLLQTVAETLLFYHPAVWWVSSRLRAEREHCCDDLAVATLASCGTAAPGCASSPSPLTGEGRGEGAAARIARARMTYARALTAIAKLALQSSADPPGSTDFQPMSKSQVGNLRHLGNSALAAAGGRLMSRIQRIVGLPTSDGPRRATWLAGALILAALLMAVPLACRKTETKPSTSQVNPTAAPAPPATQAEDGPLFWADEVRFSPADLIERRGDGTLLLSIVPKPYWQRVHPGVAIDPDFGLGPAGPEMEPWIVFSLAGRDYHMSLYHVGFPFTADGGKPAPPDTRYQFLVKLWPTKDPKDSVQCTLKAAWNDRKQIILAPELRGAAIVAMRISGEWKLDVYDVPPALEPLLRVRCPGTAEGDQVTYEAFGIDAATCVQRLGDGYRKAAEKDRVQARVLGSTDYLTVIELRDFSRPEPPSSAFLVKELNLRRPETQPEWPATQGESPAAPVMRPDFNLETTAKTLAEGTGLRWEVRKDPRHVGPAGPFSVLSAKSPDEDFALFVILPFVLDTDGQRKAWFVQDRLFNARLMVLGGTENCTVLAYVGNDAQLSHQVTKALGLAPPKVTMEQIWPAGAPENDGPGSQPPAPPATQPGAGAAAGHSLTITPPAYTGLPAWVSTLGAATVPAGSRVQWNIRFARPVTAVNVELVRGQAKPEFLSAKLAVDGLSAVAETTLNSSVAWREVHVVDGVASEMEHLRIEVRPDQPPVAELRVAGRKKDAVTARYSARDDYGLVSLTLLARDGGRNLAAIALGPARGPVAAGEYKFEFARLTAFSVKLSDVELVLVATDNRPAEPQTAESEPVALRPHPATQPAPPTTQGDGREAADPSADRHAAIPAAGSWEILSGVGGGTISASWFVDEQTGWLATTDGSLLRTADGGETWQAARIDGDSARGAVQAICCARNRTGGTYGWAVTEQGLVLHTADGQAWKPGRNLGAHLTSVQALDENTAIVASGRALWLTDDAGKSWRQIRDSLDGWGVHVVHRFAHFKDAAHGVAIFRGEDSRWKLERTADGGKTWTVGDQSWEYDPQKSLSFVHAGPAVHVFWGVEPVYQSGPLPMDDKTVRDLLGRKADHPNLAHLTRHYFLVSRDTVFLHEPLWRWLQALPVSGIQRSRDAGRTWERKFISVDFEDVFFSDVRNGWLVGAGGRTVRTADGGDTWTHQMLPTDADLTAVDFVDAKTGWAGGGRTAPGCVWHTADGGVSWKRLAEIKNGRDGEHNRPEGIAGLAFADRQRGWVVTHGMTVEPGPGGREYGRVLHTDDGGVTWRPLYDGMPLARIARHGDTFVAVGHGILQSDDGLTWTEIRGGGALSAVAFADRRRVMAVGEEGGNPEWPQFCRLSSDGGQTWKNLASEWFARTGLTSVAFANDRIGWIGTVARQSLSRWGGGGLLADHGGLLHTIDGGQTWQPCEVPKVGYPGAAWRAISAVDARHAWAVSHGTVARLKARAAE